MPPVALHDLDKCTYRPITEYAAPVWDPGLATLLNNKIERVQRRAVRIIMGHDSEYTCYSEACTHLQATATGDSSLHQAFPRGYGSQNSAKKEEELTRRIRGKVAITGKNETRVESAVASTQDEALFKPEPPRIARFLLGTEPEVLVSWLPRCLLESHFSITQAQRRHQEFNTTRAVGHSSARNAAPSGTVRPQLSRPGYFCPLYGRGRAVGPTVAPGRDGGMADCDYRQKVLHSGWLRKQGGVVKTWQRRWFVLRGDQLFYYTKEDENKLQGTIFLPGNNVLELPPNPDDPTRFLFEVVPGPGSQRINANHETYLIQAASQSEMEGWIRAIRRVIYAPYGGGWIRAIRRVIYAPYGGGKYLMQAGYGPYAGSYTLRTEGAIRRVIYAPYGGGKYLMQAGYGPYAGSYTLRTEGAIRRVIYAPYGGGKYLIQAGYGSYAGSYTLRIFGQSLEETMRYERRYGNRSVPVIIEQTAAYIRKHGMAQEGLFRWGTFITHGTGGAVQEGLFRWGTSITHGTGGAVQVGNVHYSWHRRGCSGGERPLLMAQEGLFRWGTSITHGTGGAVQVGNVHYSWGDGTGGAVQGMAQEGLFRWGTFITHGTGGAVQVGNVHYELQEGLFRWVTFITYGTGGAVQVGNVHYELQEGLFRRGCSGGERSLLMAQEGLFRWGTFIMNYRRACSGGERSLLMAQEGLFRWGLFITLGTGEAVKDVYDRGERPDFEELQADVDSVASLLKLYLRELPEPVVPFAMYDSFLQAARLLKVSEAEGVSRLAQLLKQLPDDNANLLKFLCRFLFEVQLQASLNRMTAENLATVFGPNIARPVTESPLNIMETTTLIRQLTKTLIAEQDAIGGVTMGTPTWPTNYDMSDVESSRSDSPPHRKSVYDNVPATESEFDSGSELTDGVATSSCGCIPKSVESGGQRSNGSSGPLVIGSPVPDNGVNLTLSYTELQNQVLALKGELSRQKRDYECRMQKLERRAEQQDRAERHSLARSSVHEIPVAPDDFRVPTVTPAEVDMTLSYADLQRQVKGLKSELTFQRSEYEGRVQNLEQRGAMLEQQLQRAEQELKREKMLRQ
ncbi:Rho GTPase activating protein 24, partial [Branchiostoma belcheri]